MKISNFFQLSIGRIVKISIISVIFLLAVTGHATNHFTISIGGERTRVEVEDEKLHRVLNFAFEVVQREASIPPPLKASIISRIKARSKIILKTPFDLFQEYFLHPAHTYYQLKGGGLQLVERFGPSTFALIAVSQIIWEAFETIALGGAHGACTVFNTALLGSVIYFKNIFFMFGTPVGSVSFSRKVILILRALKIKRTSIASEQNSLNRISWSRFFQLTSDPIPLPLKEIFSIEDPVKRFFHLKWYFYQMNLKLSSEVDETRRKFGAGEITKEVYWNTLREIGRRQRKLDIQNARLLIAYQFSRMKGNDESCQSILIKILDAI